jgi:hypothetical protein
MDLNSALHNAGVAASSDTRRFGERAAVTFMDPGSLTDAQLIAECSAHRLQAADIRRQLDDDKADGFTRPEYWRRNAGRAVRARLLRLDQLQEVARDRGLVAAFPELAAKLAEKAALAAANEARQKEAAAQAEARQLAKAAEQERRHQEHLELLAQQKLAKEARMLSDEKRNRTKCEMFAKAAHRMYSKDDCDRIWERAREMFPDDDAWRPGSMS